MNDNQNNQKVMAGWALHAAGATLVLLVVGASYGFGFAQFADQSEAHVARTAQLNDLLRTAPKVHKQHQLQQVQLDRLTQLTESMRDRLPNSIQKNEFNTALKQIAERVNLTLENTRWTTPKVTATHSRAELTVSGTGSYASICDFLNKINQLARITKLSKLEVESASDSTDYPFQCTFVLVYGVKSHDTEQRGETL